MAIFNSYVSHYQAGYHIGKIEHDIDAQVFHTGKRSSEVKLVHNFYVKVGEITLWYWGYWKWLFIVSFPINNGDFL